jgi:hypothetical protein
MLIGLCLAMVYSRLVLPREAGRAPSFAPTVWPILWNGMAIVPAGQHALHIHHWMLYALAYYVLPLPRILQGFALGMIVQGLTYNDRFCIVTTNPWSARCVKPGEPNVCSI